MEVDKDLRDLVCKLLVVEEERLGFKQGEEGDYGCCQVILYL